ncbi:ribonuclease D [Larsenimonas rhizosphaerae]|uniref:Ribonuclease D n=1 Tax=Larsenimonas rhizosphaerae TaxID=2944682 RepID=A0AA41ZHD6_9GAMM|nr:ribonuclease D [Larsenimonas rhizosphaerae]MCX2524605.1 ribonuclease D [Larsenimonas rhizosphaerae]
MTNALPEVMPGQWVDTPDALAAACECLAACDVLSIDTEFFRETTFHPVPALLQMGTPDRIFLVDMAALDGTHEALVSLMGRDGPLKLLHACSEDLEVLRQWLGIVPAPLADTQLAEAFTGGETSMSYQRLVEHYLDVHVPKDATRSDWLMRPLSEAQQRYATVDVLYLEPIWRRQQASLETSQRLSWFREECDALVSRAEQPRDDEHRYLRHRQAWRLEPRQLEAFRRLCLWREQEVRLRDMPRKRLASDTLLFDLAVALPKNRFELSQINEVRPPFVKREGDTLLAMIKDVLAIEPEALSPSLPAPQVPPFKPLFKSLKAVVTARAEALNISSELLGSRRDIEGWVMSILAGQPVEIVTRWRQTLLAEDIQSVAETYYTEHGHD